MQRFPTWLNLNNSSPKMNAQQSKPYRLGINIAPDSLGWFIVWLTTSNEPFELGPGGVRVYQDGRDPRSLESKAVNRRKARLERRRQDRAVKRRSNLMALLIAHSLMPADGRARKALEMLDPYKLRADALNGALPAHHVGRALFHLNQRRGFLSNRATGSAGDVVGLVKSAAARLDKAMNAEEARTLGEFLFFRHRSRMTVRVRLKPTGTKLGYEFYPTRQLLLNEFDAIWNCQAPTSPSMTQRARDEIHRVIFYQRPRKPVPVAPCEFDPAANPDDADGLCCPWAHPLAQRLRVWQQIRDLAVSEPGKPLMTLSKSDGDTLARALLESTKLTFERLGELINLPRGAMFNLESKTRKRMFGDETAAILAHRSRFGRAWRGFTLLRQIEIVTKLLTEADPDSLVLWLMETTSVDDLTAERIAATSLPDGYCRLGLRAIRKLLPYMEGGMTRAEAEAAAGYQQRHRSAETTSANGRLPYYGERLEGIGGSGDPRDGNDKRYGRFPNPSVHIALGQMRRVVNALIAQYGAPEEINLELARDLKLSPSKLTELKRAAANDRRQDERRAEDIRSSGHEINARNILKMRLWEALNRYDPADRSCLYSGTPITFDELFSEEICVDHIIPFAISVDDSAANKILCTRFAKRAKGRHTPFEAFGTDPVVDGVRFDWAAILSRAALASVDPWRFGPNARHHFDLVGGFEARQFEETGWRARFLRSYLAVITDHHKIHVRPGKNTAMIRGKWKLNDLLPTQDRGIGKSQRDHRHRAIDALVVAVTDRAMMDRMAKDYDDERSAIQIALPWTNMRADLSDRLSAMTVSYKPDHADRAVRRAGQSLTSGKLVEEKAYGFIKNPDKEDGANLVYRKGFLDLTEGDVNRIRDVRLRNMVRAHVTRETTRGIDLKAALQSFSQRVDVPGLPHGIRHVRLVKKEKPDLLVTVRDRAGRPYKAYSTAENAYVEIYEMTDGRWGGEVTSVFQANQSDYRPFWRTEYSDATFVMRLAKGDLLRVDYNGQRTVVVVHRLDGSNGRIKLAPHYEAGDLDDRHKTNNDADSFRWIMARYNTLKVMNAVRVRVDEVGKVWRVTPAVSTRASNDY